MWLEKIAKKITQKGKTNYNLTTGITPSGPFHIGHLREVLTTDIVAWAIKKLGKKNTIHFILDDFDHLRKVYPFLPKNFKKYVGKPLYLIPDPKKCHKTYSEHFFEPFKKAIDSFGLNFKIYKASELYQNGLFNKYIEISLRKRNQIAKILKKIAGTKIPKNFYPFRPLCPQCHKLTKSKILSLILNKKQMEIECECGFKGWINYLNGGGKLIWRLHWPAWWLIFKTDAEAYGKEHGTLGGSYDTGKEIMKKIFKKPTPLGIPYDLIYLKGAKGKMSSSLGNVIEVKDLINALPKELIKYIVLRTQPSKPIFFSLEDPLRLSEEISADLKRIDKLSQDKIKIYQYIFYPKKINKISFIPWSHFVLIAQVAEGSAKKINLMLKRSGHHLTIQQIKELADKALNWIKKFSTREERISILKKPKKIKLLEPEQKFLKNLYQLLLEKNYTIDELQKLIYDCIKKQGLSSKKGFSLIYQLLLGQNSGPKAGLLLKLIGKEKVLKSIDQVLKSKVKDH